MKKISLTQKTLPQLLILFLELCVVASTVSTAMAMRGPIAMHPGQGKDTKQHATLARRAPASVVVRPQAPQRPQAAQTIEEKREELTKLATSIWRDNQPHKYDAKIPAATQKLVGLFHETNPGAPLLDWNAAKASFLTHAADVDGNSTLAPPELGKSGHKTYHGLMTARLAYIERSTPPALKAATLLLLPISLYFAELENYSEGLVINSSLQAGSTLSALYNNFFIHSAKALDQQLEGRLQIEAAFVGRGGDVADVTEDEQLQLALALSQGDADEAKKADEKKAPAPAAKLERAKKC
jgi:hypothetical protein